MLKDVEENLKFPHQITQYMDCESALKLLQQEFYKPGHAMGTDSDLVMAHHQLKAASHHTVTEEWVMGHASEKKKISLRKSHPWKKTTRNATQTRMI